MTPKARFGTFLALFTGMLSLCSPLRAVEPACEIVIGSCHRAPLSAADGSGIIDRLMIEAFRRVGKRACVSALPCERSLLNADSGITDGDILRVPKVIDQRYPHLLVVPEVLYPVPISCFAMRRDGVDCTFDGLRPLRVGHLIGWKILEDRVRAADVLRVRGANELFPLLGEGKADVVIYERLTGLRTVKELGLKGIFALEPPLIVTPQHLVMHERHRALVEPLAAALRAMKADGSYERAFRAAGVPAPTRQ